MPTMFLKNGKAFLRNGAPVIGDCCCETPSTVKARLAFYYIFSTNPPGDLHGVSGSHKISVSLASRVVETESETWAANWPVDQAWTEIGYHSPTERTLAKRNGNAKIDIQFQYQTTLTLKVDETRTNSTPTWSRDMYVFLDVAFLDAGWKLDLTGESSKTITTAGVYNIGTYTKTQSNTIVKNWQLSANPR